ncbi:autotransporter domain-containing protein [Pontiellaceae bacterium B12219]|nr:autotransporter domain-containing protein [Pontiellaceae bacterium B12219]
MKFHSNRNPLDRRIKKGIPLVVSTFFLCLHSAHAQLNVSDSTIYNGSSNAAATASALYTTASGTGNLLVANPSTTSISINHAVTGFIEIDNQFSLLEITGNETLTSESTAALAVSGGTNLIVAGGSYIGGSTQVFSNDWNGSIGGYISGTATTIVSGATFSGGTMVIRDLTSGGAPPLPGQTNNITYQTPVAQGADGLHVNDGVLLLTDSSTVIGGNGQEADSVRKDAYASGGNALTLIGSSAVISNGTYRGGNGGSVDVSASRAGFAQGGNGLFASNSTAVIHSGSFNGGLGGQVNGNTENGGSGLIAIDGSSITIYSGTFTGIAGSESVVLQNSDFTSYGGLYTSGGLLSQTTGSQTNTLNLFGGSFSSLSLINAATNGFQSITASNITVSAGITQNGGTVEINNIESAAFQNLTIQSGIMMFSSNLTLSGTLNLDSANSKAMFQGLEADNNAIVNLGQGEIEANGAFNLLSGSTLNIDIVTNHSGTISAASAAFSTNSSLHIDASQAGFGSGSTTNTFLSTSAGISGFNTNDVLTQVQVTENTNVIGRTSFGGFLLNANALSAIFNTASLSNYWNATGQLAVLADELETLAPSEMDAIINNFGAAGSKSVTEETYFTTLNTFQTAKQGLNAAVGLSLSRGTEFREQLQLPTGANGPTDEQNNDWRFWAKYYGQFYSRGQDGLNAEYDSQMHGGVIGMDKSFGNLLVGISGGMGNYTITADTDAEQSMDAYQGALYATFGKEYSYIDLGLAYGMNEVESQTAAPFILDGEFDTHLISSYLGGGWGFEVPAIGTVITPEASVRYTLYQQDSYTETSTTAAPRSFDDFDADSLAGSIGVNAAMLNTTALSTFAFKLEGRAHWIREFNPRPGELSYQLVGGNSEYLIAYPYLDEDTIQLGFGFTFYNSAKQAEKNVLLRLDFDELFGKDFNSHNLSAKVIYAF